MQVQGQWQAATVMGVDRVDFPKVAFWRPDFASAPLGALMNSLAIASDGVLVEGRKLRESGLARG